MLMSRGNRDGVLVILMGVVIVGAFVTVCAVAGFGIHLGWNIIR